MVSMIPALLEAYAERHEARDDIAYTLAHLGHLDSARFLVSLLDLEEPRWGLALHYLVQTTGRNFVLEKKRWYEWLDVAATSAQPVR